MKLLFSSAVILSLCLSACAQNTQGVLLNQSSWTSLVNFFGYGTTPTVSAGAVVFSGGAINLSQSLDWVGSYNGGYTTTSNQWTQTAFNTVGAIGTNTSYGGGVGIRSTQADQPASQDSVICYVDQSSDASPGAVIIAAENAGTFTPLAVASSAVSFSAGNSIKTVATFNGFGMTCSGQNATTSGPVVSVSFTFSLVYPSILYMPNAGHFAFFNLGGAPVLTSWNITSNLLSHPQIDQVGDSISKGYYQGAPSTTFVQQLAAVYSSNLLAGAGDTTTDVVNDLAEINATQPANVILEIGVNDVCRDLDTVASTFARYQQAVTSFQHNGATVYYLLIDAPGCNMSAFDALVIAAYPSAYIIEPSFTGCLGCFNADNIHPTAAGATVIYNAEIAALASAPPASQGSSMSLQNVSIKNAVLQ